MLGIPLSPPAQGKHTNNTATVDRIDPAKGYTKDNVRIISWRANRLKSNATISELEAILCYMKETV